MRGGVRWSNAKLAAEPNCHTGGFLCRAYARVPPSRSISYALAPSYAVFKESPMLDLLFLGGGVLLLCLLIAYARLTHRL